MILSDHRDTPTLRLERDRALGRRGCGRASLAAGLVALTIGMPSGAATQSPPTPGGRPSFLGVAISSSLGATAGALLGASTQSLEAVTVGAWLGGAIGVSTVTNDPVASLVGSAGGIAAVLLAADASNEVQI